MGDNFLKPVVDSIWDLGIMASKSVKTLSSTFLSWNDYDFEKFFNSCGLKNAEGDKPKFNSWIDEGIYNLYKFEVPAGLYLGDFEKKLEALALFMKTDSVNIKFKIANDFSGIHLYRFKFDELFKKINLTNSEGIYPKLFRVDIDNEEITYIFNIPNDINLNDFTDKINKSKEINNFKLKEVDINGASYIELKL